MCEERRVKDSLRAAPPGLACLLPSCACLQWRKKGGWRRRERKITEVELQGAGISREYVRGGSRAAGGVLEGKIRLLQPLTGQGAGAHDAGLQGLLLAAVALTWLWDTPVPPIYQPFKKIERRSVVNSSLWQMEWARLRFLAYYYYFLG